jgi:hypothetical protein
MAACHVKGCVLVAGHTCLHRTQAEHNGYLRRRGYTVRPAWKDALAESRRQRRAARQGQP